MNPAEFRAIAISLATLYGTRVDKTQNLKLTTRDLEAYKLSITPQEGWTGKNEAERNLSRDRTFGANEVISRMVTRIDDLNYELSTTEAAIAGLEANRRALEWEIRAYLVSALSGRREEPNKPIEHEAFDDTVGKHLDNLISEEAQHAKEEQSWAENGKQPEPEYHSPDEDSGDSLYPW